MYAKLESYLQDNVHLSSFSSTCLSMHLGVVQYNFTFVMNLLIDLTFPTNPFPSTNSLTDCINCIGAISESKLDLCYPPLA